MTLYPRKSPNGSTIIIYGHDHGLRVLWRGGRSFRPADVAPGNDKSNAKVNGGSTEAIVIIDSDDDEPPPNSAHQATDKPSFEDEEEEFDPSEPYQSILQHLDIDLGAAALYVAVPGMPSESATFMSASMPPILSHQVVVAVACSDYSIRLVTLPLLPPSPASKANTDFTRSLASTGNSKGPHGTHMVTLGGNAGHQTVPSGVSITYTSRYAGRTEESEADMDGYEDDEPQSATRSRHRSLSKGPSPLKHSSGPTAEWDLMVSSHSPEISGLLLVYRIPIVDATSGSDAVEILSTDHNLPSQIQHLSSPTTRIAFNPSSYPSLRHSQLMVAGSDGAVRTYDCFPFGDTPHGRQGSWTFSLYTPFDTCSSSIPRRKRILDAAWVLGGKAILVLLADGEWGIWELEVAVPDGKSTSKRREKSNPGAQGTFAISGWIGNVTNSMVKSSSAKQDTISKLAPMTPFTRRIREEVLFTGPPAHEIYQAQGGISVTKVEDSKKEHGTTESVILWHGKRVLTIPDLQSYWESQTKGKGNLFGADGKHRPTKIDDLDLGGTLINNIEQLPVTGTTNRDMVIAAERRLVFLMKPLQDPTESNAIVLSQAEDLTSADQQLLARGELDVNGMKRILADMVNGSGAASTNGFGRKKKVLFR